MTRSQLLRLATYGDFVPNEKIVGSKWWEVFFRRLSGLLLVRDVELAKDHKKLNFEISDTEEGPAERNKVFQIDPFQRKSWEVDNLISNLMAQTTAHAHCQISTQSLRKNDLILKALEENFYGRFARELFDWLKLARGENQDMLIGAVPFLAGAICQFAVKSQGCEAETEKERIIREQEADENYSNAELISALVQISLDYGEIEAIIAETDSLRLRLEATEIYENLIINPVIEVFLMKENDRRKKLFETLRKAGLKLNDIGGSVDRIIAAYANYYRKQLKIITSELRKMGAGP